MGMIQFTDGSASTDHSTYTELDIAEEAQVLRLAAWSTGSAGSCVVRLFLMNPERGSDGAAGSGALDWVDTATITVSTIRRAFGSAAGQYHCTVAWTSSGTDKVDLMPNRSRGSSRWYLGVATFTTITTIDLCYGTDVDI